MQVPVMTVGDLNFSLMIHSYGNTTSAMIHLVAYYGNTDFLHFLHVMEFSPFGFCILEGEGFWCMFSSHYVPRPHIPKS